MLPFTPFQMFQLIVGPFWNSLVLIPISVIFGLFRIRFGPFLASLAFYEIAMVVIWYSFSHEFASDMATGEINTVMTIVLFNALTQLPIWWLTRLRSLRRG